MAYTNTYQRINWQNLPSEATALNDVNLNKMDAEIYAHGEQFETVDTALGHKVDKESGKGLSAIKTLSISTSANTGTDIASISYKDQNNLTVGYTIKNGVVVDSSLSGSSTNPVQNKVVKSALDGKSTVSIADTLPTGDTIANLTIDGTTTAIKAPLVEVDDELSTSSTNPVQNKIITEALREIMPEVTVTGNPISISDGSNVIPAKLAEVTFLPKQDLHGYDSPWVGGAGKNKLNATGTQANCTLADGVYTLNSVPSSNSNFVVGTVHLAVGDYKINGGYDNNFRININVGGTYYTSKGDDVAFSIATEGDYQVGCIILTSATAGKQIKPMIRLSSIADATFAPYSNICPISGWTEVNLFRNGVNQWDEQWESGSINNTTGQNQNAGTNRIRSKNYIPVFPQTTYYFYNSSGVNCFIYYYKADKTFIGMATGGSGLANVTFTTPAECYYVRFRTNDNYGTTYGNNIAVNYPSTDTTYHAYNGHTYTETLGATYYGGKVDFVSGEVVIDKAYKVFNGGSGESWSTAQNAFYIDTAFTDASSNFETNGNTCVCNMYAEENAVSTSSQVSSRSDFSFFNQKGTYYYRLWVKNRNYASVDAFKTALASQNLQIVYPLGTPITLTLTAQQIELLKGANVLWSDSNGNIKLTYSADIKAFIESQLTNS